MKETIKKIIEMLSGFGSQQMEDVGVPAFLFVMLVSLLCALFAAYLYLHFFSQRATGSQIHRSFPLLGVSVTAIFICVQFSLPLSLGLLGALSIVRFRTPIKEPEEIGFVMLVIAISIACATFNFVFLGILLLTAIGACLALSYGPRFLKEPIGDGVLIVTLPQAEYSAKYDELMKCLDELLRRGRILSVTKSGDESVISYNFKGMRKGALPDLQARLESMLGSSNYNIYFNRAGTP